MITEHDKLFEFYNSITGFLRLSGFDRAILVGAFAAGDDNTAMIPAGVMFISAERIWIFNMCLQTFLPSLILMWLFVTCSVTQLSAEEPADLNKHGKKIYATQCAGCHGVQGQGTKDFFEDPLEGDLPVGELAEYISDTMPEEDPDQCVAEDANAVADYIHAAFYSESSRAKRNNTRIEIQRRTVRQYRESVAELVDSFNNREFWIPDERGINAHYFAWGEWNDDRRLAEQVDQTIDFPKENGGVPHFRADNKYEGVKEIKRDNDMGKGFSVFWHGGIIAPRTGKYDFVVNCRNGFKLYVNGDKNPLIDRWVRSDDELTHQASVHLLAGRPYCLKLDIFSYTEKEVTAQLQWKPPGETLSTVPSSALIYHIPDESIVISSPFPADDASAGYERGTSVSRQWDEATTSAAIEAAAWISDRIWKLAQTKDNADDRKEKVIQFCYEFVERAFVKKMTDEERKFFVDQHFETDLSIADQVKRVVLLTLKSPRYLYPELQERDGQLQMAQRLALLFWDSLPDKKLYTYARNGELNEDKYPHCVYRLLNDPRAKAKLRNFFNYWLRMDTINDANKDAEHFPNFDEHVLRDLRKSLELHVDSVVWSEESDYRQLYLTEYLFANKRIASFYSIDSDEIKDDEQSFAKVQFESEKRAGILTHPYVMTGLAYHNESSPIHRGVFVARSLIGRSLRQPPDDVEPLTEEFAKGLTMRERVEQQTKETSCMNCHQVINPLGFSLENFDAVGRFRSTEKEKPINTQTVYETPNGETVNLKGPRDLAKFLANDKMAQRSFIRHLFNYYTKQSVMAYGENTLDELHQKFIDHNFSVKKLLKEIANLVTREHK